MAVSVGREGDPSLSDFADGDGDVEYTVTCRKGEGWAGVLGFGVAGAFRRDAEAEDLIPFACGVLLFKAGVVREELSLLGEDTGKGTA